MRPSLRSRYLAAASVAATVLLAAGLPARDRLSMIESPNASGVLRTVLLDGNSIDLSNPFFQSLGTNGRSCASCHVAAAGWTITPEEVQNRFDATGGTDPIFRTNDGSNSPDADCSSVAARRSAYSMLLTKALIRVGLPIPRDAEFELVDCDDPYGFADETELSLFRRPLPSTNLRFITGVMWDARESFAPHGTFPILSTNTPAQNARALLLNLKHQSNEATTGHAKGQPINDAQREAIVKFEMNLATAQIIDRGAGVLTGRRARGGPEYLAEQKFYVTINDVLGEDVDTHEFDPNAMTLYDAWADSKNPRQAAIARGQAIFNDPRINISGVGGLNDDLGIPAIRSACTACHDSPNVGNHSVALPIDIGLTDEDVRTPDMPLYTLRNKHTGETRKTTDPGRALLTGKWKDIGKFKGPVLRGLAARAPYFHNGMAKDLAAVVDFYDTRFGIGFTNDEKDDLIAFLEAL